ncbi:hypothetical protein RB1704 [Rhodopirellula baltica SH 1]|uniref:Uncharacterized protein n=1 Tax=Rhodopirellula baltica (strain DSM 10527 / NCIMB 13988 / SH1) TaxID=243090 RepID=Q7UWY7_RHOBA|nr:hypothetical protein RB1704 [Rhodopirellula baltica SH 1]
MVTRGKSVGNLFHTKPSPKCHLRKHLYAINLRTPNRVDKNFGPEIGVSALTGKTSRQHPINWML